MIMIMIMIIMMMMVVMMIIDNDNVDDNELLTVSPQQEFFSHIAHIGISDSETNQNDCGTNDKTARDHQFLFLADWQGSIHA